MASDDDIEDYRFEFSDEEEDVDNSEGMVETELEDAISEFAEVVKVEPEKAECSSNILGKRKLEDVLETDSDKDTVEGLNFVEEVDVRKKRLFVANLSLQTEILDIIRFFQDVAEVVNVRLIVDHEGKHVGYGIDEFASVSEAKKALEDKNGQYMNYCKIIFDDTQNHQEAAVPKKTLFVDHFSPETTEISDVPLRRPFGCGFVEFASANEAKKALQKKNGGYLHDRKIFLDVAYRGGTYLPPLKYCKDHKVWYEEDYLQRESLAVKGLDETPSYSFKLADVAVFVANLSPQTEISEIINFFEDVGEVVSVRLIVNHEGKNVGYAFVEFASPNEAKKVFQEKNGEYLDDQKILLIKGFDQATDFVEAVRNIRNKTLFVDNLSGETEISDIINFFKDVGEVVHVRLIVDYEGKHLGCGFVEFACAYEATEALEKKNSVYLHNREIILDVAIRGVRYHGTPKYCIDHKVWYENYLQNLVIEKDAAAIEGLDETPDFSEEVAASKKTVFVDKIPYNIGIKHILKIFKDVGEVVRARLIVDQWAHHVGCCFVELCTANEAKKAVEEKNGEKFMLKVAEIDRQYPFRPKYSIAEFAQKLWYNPYRRRNRKSKLEKLFCGKRTIFSEED